MFSHILVPTDFSALSDEALACAGALAARCGATLHLVHVVEAPFVTGPLGTEVFVTETPAVHEHLVEDAKEHLGVRASGSGVSIIIDVVTGTAARAILAYAETHHIDLIVMGTHGRSGMAHLLMGSVAEKVLRNAPCPVMTVRRTAARARVAPEVTHAMAATA